MRWSVVTRFPSRYIRRRARLPGVIMQVVAAGQGSLSLGSFAARMTGARLDAVFSPRSIAVVGASRHPGKIGYEILRNLIVNEYQGILYHVNPNARSIHGIRAYPTVGDIPDPIDLAVITVPADLAIAAAEECGRKGVRGLVVITAGFREVGGAGIEREERLLRICREYNMTMIGPNCMGVINTHPEVRMDATFAPTPPLSGGISLVTQSGALGIAILEHAKSLGIGFAKFCSLGNKAQVSLNDLLEIWRTDSDTKIVLAYIENFGNPGNFVRIARATTKEKPVIAVKSGRSEAGSRAAMSHTGSLGGSDLAAEAVFAQTGVLRAASIEELFDLAMAFSLQPLPRGNRVAVVSDAGGPAVMCVDELVAQGLRLAEFSSATESFMRTWAPPEASLRNPVDLTPQASLEDYRRALDAVLADEGVDAANAIYVPLVRIDEAAAEAILKRARDGGRILLREGEASALLQAYGIRTAKARIVPRIEDLAPAAAQIGYPVVLKAVGPELVHKTELQAVRVDLRSERELNEAASQMERHLRERRIAIEGFVLQEFVQGGMEVVLGMSRDKVYGPFLVFGLGGVYVEYLKDVAFGLPPLTDRDAMRMIESIRTYPMLRGVRGQPPRDVAALQDAILRLAALVADFDVIQEMDLNPVLALEEGRGYRAVDARILLAPPSNPTQMGDTGTRAA